jgi:lysophospholipase L1-like esterase
MLVVLGGSAGLAGLEGALRYMDPARGLPLDDEGRTSRRPRYTWGHPVVVNSFGFREREVRVPKPSGTYRIMVLGDSFTWGAGLGVGERYTDLLETALAAHFAERRRLEVLNFGIPGGPTVDERNILRKYKDLVRPDLVVVGFCLNDPQPHDQDYSRERERFENTYGRVLRKVRAGLTELRLSRLGATLDTGAYRLAEVLGIIPVWQVALDRAYEPSSPEWREFERALGDIRRMADEMGLPPPIFAVLNQGTSTVRPTDYEHPDGDLRQLLRWYHQATEAAERAGFVAYGHEREIARELHGQVLAVNVLDGHPSAALNRVYARKLYEVAVPIIERDLARRGAT